MSIDPFDNARAISTAGPGRDYLPVTPSDVTDLPQVAISVYVETAGAVCFVSAAGNTRTVALPDHGWLLCGVRRVLATGTTAAGIHAVALT
jgi:hypothetical protein